MDWTSKDRQIVIKEVLYELQLELTYERPETDEEWQKRVNYNIQSIKDQRKYDLAQFNL